jgi:hypothetical protein
MGQFIRVIIDLRLISRGGIAIFSGPSPAGIGCINAGHADYYSPLQVELTYPASLLLRGS